MEISANAGLLLSGLLFLIGLTGVMVRKNILFQLMSIEIMLIAAGIAFVVAGAFFGEVDGQVMYLFILAVSAAEVSVGLGLIIAMYKQFGTLNTSKMNNLNG